MATRATTTLHSFAPAWLQRSTNASLCQRAGADGVINWRYAEYGNTLHDSNSDPVFAALNSAAINLAECDRDLIMGVPAAGAGGVAAGDAAEEEEGEAALPGL